MPSSLYINNFDTQFIAAVKSAPDTGTPATELGYGVLQLPGAVGATLPVLTSGNWFMLTLYKLVDGLEDDIEIVKVTAVDTSSGSETRISVDRAQEGTSAQAYAIGDKVSLRMTAGSAANKLQKTNNLSDLPSVATARTNLGLGTAALVDTGTGATNAILGNDARLTDSRTPTGAAGGVLSGTYPNPGFAVDMATQTELDNHINDSVGAHDGTAIANTPTGNISATNVQAAINELDTDKEPSITAGTASQYWRGNKTWADFFTDVRAATLTGLSTATNAVITATDTVLTALGKLQKQVTDNLATLTGHTGAASGAHAATAISNAPAGSIAATTVQAAINELDTEKVAKSGDTMTGNLNFSGTGLRLTGDFSNVTVANRLIFQTSTAGGGSNVGALPNGTVADNTGTGFVAWGNSDPATSQNASLYCFKNLEARITSGSNTGTFLPMTFHTGGSERLRIDASGNVGIGKTPAYNLDIRNQSGNTTLQIDAFGGTSSVLRFNSPTFSSIESVNVLGIFVNSAERMRIDTSGNVLIGTTTAFAKLAVNGTFYVGAGSTLSVGNVNNTNAATINSDSTNGAANMVFKAAQDGLAAVEALRIDGQTRNVLVTGSGGLGYGVGSGGTVTQTGSISTGVALNKPSMTINLFRAAWGASEVREFYVANSLAGPHDSVAVSIAETGISATWFAIQTIFSAGGGGIFISIRNVSGVALPDTQVTLKLQLIKGAAS